MSVVKKLDILGFFNQIQEPVVVFSEESDIFLNDYFKKNFLGSISSWKELFGNHSVKNMLSGFFSTGELGEEKYISPLIGIDGSSCDYSWEFRKLYSDDTQRYCAAIGTKTENTSFGLDSLSFLLF